ncbi:hypothetical protein DFH28DRAFT_1118965 [Melampsora americana]|nr:hypothetical protein DFH28DRAFT_1118965 [Melampsora americana]
MVQALTSPHFTNTHHLQPRTTGVESIDHCLSSPYLNSRNILGTDDGADAELPTHLKDIEYALMEDTNFEVLEYLNKNPDSDTTLLWNTISQEMQSLATKDPESVIQSPNPKRQRVGMTTRADHPVMECKHSNCHQDSTSTYLERDQLDSLASNSDPEMFHSSHNTRERKSREKLTRIQHSAQASKARKHPKSKFQGSAKLPKIEGVEKELFYSHFQSRTIANLLKLKGTLALWHNHMVSRQIDSFFDNLDKNLYTTLWSSSEITYPSDKVILAIERIKTDIVIAFFGGLRMMLHIGQKDVSIKTVVSNGWAYLKQYLNQVFHLNQNELSKILSVPNIDPHNFSSPINLPNYMLKLDKNSPVQPSLIGALLSNWATEADHTPLQHKIEFSTQSFLSVIVSEAELRGKRIWATNHELQMDELRKLKTGRPAIIFSRIANHSISDELKTYHSDSVIIDSKRIQNTISAVKLYLIPAFLGLLISLSP